MVAAQKFRKRREFLEMRQHSPWTLKFESRGEQLGIRSDW